MVFCRWWSGEIIRLNYFQRIMFWSGEKGQKRGAIFCKKSNYWKSNIYPFYSLCLESEYLWNFCKWLIFNAYCINFWKMEGRVCLRVRIPYALSTLKNGNRFFFCGLFWACWRLFEAKDDTIIVFGWKTAVWACFGLGLAVFHKEWRKKDIVDGKELFLRCPSQREGVSGRGWAGFRSAPCVFFCFWVYKKPKKAILVSGAGPDFLETIFWKDAENHVFATIAANFIDFCS